MTWHHHGTTIEHPDQVVLERDLPRRLAFTWHTFTPGWAEGSGSTRRQPAVIDAEPGSRVSFSSSRTGTS